MAAVEANGTLQANTKTTTEPVRPLANFPPSVWGDRFLSFSLDNTELEGYAKAMEEPKEEVRRLIVDPTMDSNKKLSLIYSVHRLGLTYLFLQEIEAQLDNIFKAFKLQDYDEVDLYTTSINFQVFRHLGHKLPCDVFNKFKDSSSGTFKESITKGREAEKRGCPIRILSLDEFDPSSLPCEEYVIFVVSTTGQGDTPNSMKAFWTFLLQRSLNRQWLEKTNYTVFGLGDSGYQKYNFVAKKLDKRLADLGGTTILERGLGDDQHPSGYEGSLDPWMSSLWAMLYNKNPKFFPKGLNISVSDMKMLGQPKVEITYLDSNAVHSQPSAQIDLKLLEKDIVRCRSMLSAKKSNDKSKPDCFLKLVKNQPITRTSYDKDVRHLEFEPLSSTIEYEVGDVLEILPSQSPEAIDAFMTRCNLNPESYIIVKSRNKEDSLEDGVGASKDPIKLKTFVELTMDIASASPRRYFFEVMSFFASAEHEKERLEYFASPEGRDDLYQYNQKERRTVLEVLEDFPSVDMPFEWLVQLTPPLKTRAFSISSSPHVHPNQVHLTVSIVSWTTPFKRKRIGLCSNWLASLHLHQRVCIPAWFHKGSLPAPHPSLPLILIGPGTGCAPFRGFVEERALNASNSGPILFFFGCRNEDNDFLYKDFWVSHSQNGGVLSEEKGGGFYVAFSRDQPQKVYVQHKMREQSGKVWELLSKGAAVYVAGSSSNMPADVLAAFEEIVERESGVEREAAVRWLRMLERGGKYHVEAWA